MTTTERDNEMSFEVHCPWCDHEWSLTVKDITVTSDNKGIDIQGYLTCPKCGEKQDLME
jgi:hypothetical protein